MTAELVWSNKIYEDTIEIFKIFFYHNLIDSEKNKLSQHLKNTFKNDIDILNFNGELDQFLAFLREGKEKCNDAISICQAANEMSFGFGWKHKMGCL